MAESRSRELELELERGLCFVFAIIAAKRTNGCWTGVAAAAAAAAEAIWASQGARAEPSRTGWWRGG